MKIFETMLSDDTKNTIRDKNNEITLKIQIRHVCVCADVNGWICGEMVQMLYVQFRIKSQNALEHST